jgi:transposase
VSEHSDLFGRDGRRLLNELVVRTDRRLPLSGKVTLKGHLQLLDHVRRQLASVTRGIRRQLAPSRAGRRLMTLPGVGQVLAYTLVAEIGRIERFRSAKHLASYSLVVPRARDSGTDGDEPSPKGRRIGHAGRRTLQWAWIEAAHGAVRSGGEFRALFDRVTDAGQRDRNRGYVTVAHQLCLRGYVLWDKDVDYRTDRPARPGQRSEAGTSRSGTGQPDHPMVAVVAGRLQTS